MVKPTLYADRGCPFAHRILALFDQLGIAPELRLSDFGETPDGLHVFSPSGRIPFLVHGEVAIGESRVILEYLAEAHGFAEAWPAALQQRARQRHAMALIDEVLVPNVFREAVKTAKDEARLAECLSAIEEVATTAPAPSLLAFHVAPMWLRLQWWQPEGAATRAIRARPYLAAWLDAAAALPSVGRTAPDAAENRADFERARAAGKGPA